MGFSGRMAKLPYMGPDGLQGEEVFEVYPADQVQSLARRLGEAKHYLSSAAAMVDEALAHVQKDTTLGDEQGHHIALSRTTMKVLSEKMCRGLPVRDRALRGLRAIGLAGLLTAATTGDPFPFEAERLHGFSGASPMPLPGPYDIDRTFFTTKWTEGHGYMSPSYQDRFGCMQLLLTDDADLTSAERMSIAGMQSRYNPPLAPSTAIYS